MTPAYLIINVIQCHESNYEPSIAITESVPEPIVRRIVELWEELKVEVAGA